MDKPETISKAIVIKRESPTDLFFRFVPSSSSSYVPNTLICIFNIKVYIYTSVGELVYGMAWHRVVGGPWRREIIMHAKPSNGLRDRNGMQHETRTNIPRTKTDAQGRRYRDFKQKFKVSFFYINQIKELPAAAVA